MKKELKVASLTRLTTFGSVMIILLGIVISTVMTKATDTAASLNLDQKQADSYGRQLADTSDYLTNKVRAYAATGDKTYYDAYWKEINETKRREEAIEKLTQLGITDEEMGYINKMKEASDGLIPLEEAAMGSVEKGDLKGAVDTVYGPAYMSGKEQVTNNVRLFNESLAARYDGLQEKNTHVLNLESVSVNLVFLLMFIVSITNYLVTKIRVVRPLAILSECFAELSRGRLSVRVPLQESTSEIGVLAGSIQATQAMLQTYISDIGRNLEEMARGDLGVEITMEYIGDFTALKESINHIAAAMRQAMGRIREGTTVVTDGAGQISQSMQAISKGAQEEAQTVEEISGSIREAAAQIQNNASYASSASTHTLEVGGRLNESNDKMRELTTAIQGINDSSSQIKDIIKTIEDIAFQTNILALNAAVEAARAGAAGKGFAVVADEVRSLASKSAEAAKRTTALIGNSISAAETGSRLAQSAAGSLLSLVDGAREIEQAIAHISDETHVQADTITQITSGMEQISGKVQLMSAQAQESAAASQILNGQAQVLNGAVDKFRLPGNRTGGGAQTSISKGGF